MQEREVRIYLSKVKNWAHLWKKRKKSKYFCFFKKKGWGLIKQHNCTTAVLRTQSMFVKFLFFNFLQVKTNAHQKQHKQVIQKTQ